MPTENELKFVIRLDDKIEHKAKELGKCFRMDQGYLQSKSRLTVRIRRQLESETNITTHLLQTKFKVKRSVDTGNPRIIEISSEIGHRDFEDFWKKSKGKLVKNRYKILTGVSNQYHQDDGSDWQEIWEIDFFKNKNNENYFIMAEVEIPEGMKQPLFRMPDIIQENLLYRVPLGDSRFSNSRLGNEINVNSLYKTLVKKTERVLT